MNRSNFDYSLDPSLIATRPLTERDQSRLLVYHRKRQVIEHRKFCDLHEYLQAPDLLVFNDSRVFPARLRGRNKEGELVELLFLRPRTKSDEGDGEAHHSWEVLFKGKCRLPIHLWFEGDVEGTITQDLGGGLRELILNVPDHLYSDVYSYLEEWGEVPLPPYILRQRTSDVQFEPFDRMRYQTVYAETWGSAAAPTAGLHFTKASIARLKRKGIQTATTTLHIGLDTFQPIRSESIFEHQMHREWFKVPIST